VLHLTPPKVFGESSQLRSWLKTDICVQVQGLKTLFPDNISNDNDDDDIFEAQRAAIRTTISEWIADGSYLHNTIPGSVSTSALSLES
jgi:hypothetical protein